MLTVFARRIAVWAMATQIALAAACCLAIPLLWCLWQTVSLVYGTPNNTISPREWFSAYLSVSLYGCALGLLIYFLRPRRLLVGALTGGVLMGAAYFARLMIVYRGMGAGDLFYFSLVALCVSALTGAMLTWQGRRTDWEMLRLVRNEDVHAAKNLA